MGTIKEYLNETIKSVTSATDFASAGAANAWQDDMLLNWTLSETVLFGPPWGSDTPLISVVPVAKEQGEWHSSKFTGDALVGVSETDTTVTENKPAFDKVSYQVKMFQCQFDITRKAILDSVAAPRTIPIGGQTDVPIGNFWDEITKERFEQIGNALEKVAIRGDTSLLEASYPLLFQIDGYDVLTESGTGANLVNAAGTSLSWDLFRSMYEAMPYQYIKKGPYLKWLLSIREFLNYLAILKDRATSAGDAALRGVAPGPMGIDLIQVPIIPEDLDVTVNSSALSDGTYMWLVDPKNFYFFIRRNLERDIDYVARAGGGTYEVTTHIEVDAMVKTPQAVVKAYNISPTGDAYTA